MCKFTVSISYTRNQRIGTVSIWKFFEIRENTIDEKIN